MGYIMYVYIIYRIFIVFMGLAFASIGYACFGGRGHSNAPQGGVVVISRVGYNATTVVSFRPKTPMESCHLLLFVDLCSPLRRGRPGTVCSTIPKGMSHRPE